MNHHHAKADLSHYSFFELYQPEILLLVLAAMYLYFRKTGTGATLLQKVSMMAALALVYVVKGSPLSIIGHHYLFSVHMVQMAILYLMIPPLVLYGIPERYWQQMLQGKTVWHHLFTFLTKPLIAIILFNALFSLYHLPLIFDTVSNAAVLHYVYHSILLITAFTMWWPVMTPVETNDQLSDIKKVGYIFANGVLMTPACALIMFADTQLYAAYEGVPQLFSYMPPHEDQHVGGVIMKIIQEVVYAFVLGLIFYRWVKKERIKDKEDLESIKQSALAPQHTIK
ncbi:cytochrome c oxidase assembly protein [Fictibacillus iocasae]|uniref:Cytochrome c oxidase assembly protein n=1 Tax=Fictibacillus iocasae TaxID=2715437 RepID=A0ABW2NR28_9BACL